MANRSEAQRRADAAYYARHKDELAKRHATLSFRLPRPDADRFKKLCKEHGIEYSDVLRKAVYKFMEDYQNNT